MRIEWPPRPEPTRRWTRASTSPASTCRRVVVAGSGRIVRTGGWRTPPVTPSTLSSAPLRHRRITRSAGRYTLLAGDVGYPDIEALLVTYLKSATGRRVVTDLPGDLETLLPLIQVVRTPSPAGYRLDRPLVDVSVWGAKAQRSQVSNLSQQVLDLVVDDLPGTRRPTGVVTAATVEVAPNWRPDPNPNLCRYLASYRFAAHS